MMKPEIEQVTIVGVGLIGGSLGLCFREHGIRVTGYDADEQRLQQALAHNVIDRAEQRLSEATLDADAIFLCTPVRTISHFLAQLAAIPLKPGTIVTDTGSTKKELLNQAKQLDWRGAVFIGGHPMAGSHRSGVEAARSDLFENAYYVLTPAAEPPPNTMARLTRLCELTRAKVVHMDAADHDRVVAAISHWPHVLAALLVRQVGQYNEENDWYHRLAAGGFRDLTRIASSNPQMWRDITLSNRNMILQLLTDWQRQLTEFESALIQGQATQLEAFFAEAKRYREQLPHRKKGVLPPIYECYIDVPDHPGMIGQVATLLGRCDINLANIGILENREEVAGVLRLSFYREAEFHKAVSVLKEHRYTVYQLDHVNGDRRGP